MLADAVVLRRRVMSCIGMFIVAGGMAGVVLGIVGPRPNPSFADHAVLSGFGAIFVAIGRPPGCRNE